MAQNYYGEAVGHHAGYELRLAFYEKIAAPELLLPRQRPFRRPHHARACSISTACACSSATGLVRVVLLGVLIGVGAYLLISTDLVLGLLSLSFVPFVAWRSSVTQLKLRSTWLELQERLTVLSRVMDENLGGIRVVRAFAAQRARDGEVRGAKQDALDLAHERVDMRVSNTAPMNFSFFPAMGLVLWVGGDKVIAGEITVGTLAQFLTFMTILQMPVRQLGLMVNSFARASTCGTRLFDLLDLELDIKDKPGAKDLEITDGMLRFDNVGFRYRGRGDRPTLSRHLASRPGRARPSASSARPAAASRPSRT